MIDAGHRSTAVLRIFRTACFVVTVVAGIAGTVMLLAPDTTHRYFSWPIGPPPLAALVGAFYLTSALTFAILGLREDWPASRGVCFGVLAFTLPTVVATLRHRDLFDWGRWQAVAWIMLFLASPLAFSSFLFLLRGRITVGGTPLRGWARAVLGLLGAFYGMLAVVLLFAPGRLQEVCPFPLPGLSGRFLGSWCAFLAVLATFAAWRNRTQEAVVPVMALLMWPVAAVVAALRSFNELQPSFRRSMYLAVAVVLAALAAAALAVCSRAESSATTPTTSVP
ncbi:MAG TPA: hypothetical protein VF711_10375 [Acidimicrobiales bacterium]